MGTKNAFAVGVRGSIVRGEISEQMCGGYGRTPNLLFTSELSDRAKVVCGWWCGRPDGWVPCMKATQAALRLTAAQWKAVSAELRAGKDPILKQEQVFRLGGMVWHHTVDLSRFYGRR